MVTDTMICSDSDDYTFCRLIEGQGQLFRLSSWELGLEIAKNIGGVWVPIYDDSYMIVIGDNRKFADSPYVEWYTRDERSVSHDACVHFRRTVPKEIQQIVGGHFKYSQIHLLKSLRFCPELKELARSCLPLFWLVVERNSEINVLKSWEFACLLRLKRKNILERLGYTGTQAAVRLLSKIKIDCFRDEDLFALKDVMGSAEKISLLRHFKVVSEAHLFAAIYHPELLDYTFARNELSRKNTSPEAFKHLVSIYKDTCIMAEVLMKGDMDVFFHTIKHCQELKKRHDDLVLEINVMDINTRYLEDLVDTYGKETFPPVPVPGSETIKPICSLPELESLGNELQNCILTYAQQIYEGKFFCYKILKPESGIFGLDLTQERPKIVGVSLKQNRAASPAMVQAVDEWLHFMTMSNSTEKNNGEFVSKSF